MDKLHFSHLISTQANLFGDKIALCARQDVKDNWTKYSWKDFDKRVALLARAFVEIGITEHQCVAQFSHNKAENLFVDFALFANRAVMVPMYATSTVQQVEFIVNDAKIELIFVGDQYQLGVAQEVMQNSEFLKRIIVFDRQVVITESEQVFYFDDFLKLGENSTKQFVVEQRANEALEDDLATILYTSGTTGNPKGVMLTHSCFNEGMRIHSLLLTSITANDTSVAFLPLSHVFERLWSYFCIYKGVTIYLNTISDHIQQTLQDVRPTLMCSVPRFWEKVYIGVKSSFANLSPFMLNIVSWAIAIGKTYNLDYLRTGKEPDKLLKFKYYIANQLIFRKLKIKLGLENANMLPVAGAKLSDEIATFFLSIGIPIIYGYGLTESTATVSCFPYVGYEIGTVGTIIPDLQVGIGTDHEILLKGKTIFSGYYNNPEATAAAFTSDGWFRTGDAGYIENNTLVLTDRIKDMFKTSNGKYVAPQEIETRLTSDSYINQVAVIGDERSFVTALIVPYFPALEAYAHKNIIQYDQAEDLIKMQEIKDLISERIKVLQSTMASYEQIKRFTLVADAFSIDNGALTNTMKMRRSFIMNKYKMQIEKMYLD
jgi:long-chain acyl-CoA synthetase